MLLLRPYSAVSSFWSPVFIRVSGQFESPSRQGHKSKKPPSGGFFVLCRGGEKQGPCGPCAGDSKGCPCRGSPLRIVHLPPLRGGAPEAPRAAPKIPANTISCNQFVRISALMPLEREGRGCACCVCVYCAARAGLVRVRLQERKS